MNNYEREFAEIYLNQTNIPEKIGKTTQSNDAHYTIYKPPTQYIRASTYKKRTDPGKTSEEPNRTNANLIEKKEDPNFDSVNNLKRKQNHASNFIDNTEKSKLPIVDKIRKYEKQGDLSKFDGSRDSTLQVTTSSIDENDSYAPILRDRKKIVNVPHHQNIPESLTEKISKFEMINEIKPEINEINHFSNEKEMELSLNESLKYIEMIKQQLENINQSIV